MAVEAEFTLLEEIMTEPGRREFSSYLTEHPDMTESQKREAVASFLDKYANDEMIEEELDVPGWTVELVDHLTELYDEDLFAIQRIPGVTLIEP